MITLATVFAIGADTARTTAWTSTEPALHIGTKIVEVGDPRQLRGVGVGSLMGIALVAVFGALFAGADATFAGILSAALSTVDGGSWSGGSSCLASWASARRAPAS